MKEAKRNREDKLSVNIKLQGKKPEGRKEKETPVRCHKVLHLESCGESEDRKEI